jgi:hypothetical protein
MFSSERAFRVHYPGSIQCSYHLRSMSYAQYLITTFYRVWSSIHICSEGIADGISWLVNEGKKRSKTLVHS